MANISRNSFNESKQYDKVILQQGVPVTDYDFNEMQDIQRLKLRRIIKELMGDGAIGDAFRCTQAATPNNTILVSKGALYISGYRVYVGQDVTVTLPAAPTSGTRVDMVYIEVTEQEIDSVKDPEIKHPRLTLEPTRRIQISSAVKVGATVPLDTATATYYKIAEVNRTANNNAITNANIVDKRSVKATFEGDGFDVKGSVTLGDDESDIIAVRGRVKNPGTTFGGRIYLDDDVEITGGLYLTGGLTQKGKLMEVGRMPIFGIAGDLQYQSDAKAWEDVTANLYSLFSTTYALPSVPSGATRKYKLQIAFSDSGVAAGANGYVRLYNKTKSSELTKFSLGYVQGANDSSRRFAVSPEFTAADNLDHYVLQAQIQNAAGNYAGAGEITIMYVELIAYDVY